MLKSTGSLKNLISVIVITFLTVQVGKADEDNQNKIWYSLSNPRLRAVFEHAEYTSEFVMLEKNEFKVDFHNQRTLGKISTKNQSYGLILVTIYEDCPHITLAELSQFRKDLSITVNEIRKRDDYVILSTQLDFYNGMCLGQLISRLNSYAKAVKELQRFCY